MSDNRARGFNLMELMVVVVIIGIMAVIAIPSYNTSQERALGQEAKANLKLIRAAERIYKMETDSYYFSADAAAINDNLKLSLTETNWEYSVTNENTFTAYADRVGDDENGYLDCQYSINQSQEEPVVANGKCP